MFFSDLEVEFIKSQRLTRIATVSPEMQPDVAPVGFDFDGERFFVSGYNITRTFKYKNVKAGNLKVALVVDDLASVSPWVARGVKVHGTAEIAEKGGRATLVIQPDRHWSWGIEDPAFVDGKPVSRKVWHTRE